MTFVDSSYDYGTEESRENRLIIHLKGADNLELYTNCYSDWQKCSTEFICYKPCQNWQEAFIDIKHGISKQWEISHVYSSANGEGK